MIGLIIMLYIGQVVIGTTIRLERYGNDLSRNQYICLLLIPFSGLFFILRSALKKDY